MGMNILIVDDQRSIVDGLKNGLNWERLQIEEVHTACSAREARLVLMNFDIHILLTDIEMPEEDGLALMQWAKEKNSSLVGIFLTSHADFDYAREAISMGGFDYILQPARYEDVEKTLMRAVEEARKVTAHKRLEASRKNIRKQRDVALELLLERHADNRTEECRELFTRIQEMLMPNFEKSVFYPCFIEIVSFRYRENQWTSGLIKLVFRNVLEELLEEEHAKACIARQDTNRYVVLAAMSESDRIGIERWTEVLESFADFFNRQMDFTVAVYPDYPEIDSYRPERLEALYSRTSLNHDRKPGMYYQEMENVQTDENEERIRMAEDYIKMNINRSISRTEVAEYLHLNEEYFSRLFKKYTGYTFKDYDTMTRMDIAKMLLSSTRFSVSIIASKVGYDNFSYFSKAFKKNTGKTPQEYRENV